MNGPHWIKQWIADLALLNDQFRNEDGSVDFSALGREEYQFRMALITRKFSNSERAKDIFEKAKAAYEVNVERGKKGGRPRKDATTPDDKHDDQETPSRGGSAATHDDQETPRISTDEDRQRQRRTDGHSLRVGNVARPPVRSSGAMPDDVQLVYDFAAAENLDPVDAYECWNVTVNERDGKTSDSKRITNWKAYVRKWCVTRASNRRTA